MGGAVYVYLTDCIDLIAYLLKKLKIEERLEALIEICWRYTCLMIPLPNCLVQVIEETLQAVNPFPRNLTHLAADALTILRPDRPLPDEVKQLNWSSVSRQWVELAFVLLRDAWDDQNEEKFTLWSSRLEPVVGLRLEWKVQWCSESCQFFLARLDESRVRTVLTQWPELAGEPWWEAKKAAVLAELGDVDEALAIARKARGQIEGVRNIPFNDFRAPSQEAWIRYLEQFLEQATVFSRSASYDEGPRFRLEERVRELARFHCDPDRDLYYWEGKLARGQTRPDRLPTRGFDDGDLRQPRSSSGFSVFAEWILVHFFRDAPIPIVAARYHLYPDALRESARLLWRQNPKLAISLMVRCGFKDLDELIARHVLARMETTYAGDLFDWLSTVLRQAMRALREMSPQQRRKEETLHHRIVERVPDIVSRFFCRLNDVALERALELAIAYYNERPHLDELKHHTSAEVLLKRVLASAAPEQVLAWLPRLVRLPIPDWDGFSTEGRSFGNSQPGFAEWPDPVELVQFPDWFEATVEMLPEPQKHELVENLRWLLQIVQSGSEQARRRALSRLEKLRLLNLLQDREVIEYRSAFRAQRQSDEAIQKAGLLVSLDLFPEENMREAGVAAEIKGKLLQGPLGTYPEEQKRYLHDIYQASTMPWYEPEHNQWRIDWTPAEVVRLLEHLEAITPAPGSPRFVGMDERVAAVLRDVVILRLQDAQDTTKVRALNLLQILNTQSRVNLGAQPATLVIQPISATDVANQLRVGIHSRGHKLIAEAAIGLERWVCLGRLGLVPAMPTFLVDDLVALILSARQPGLEEYIEAMTELLSQQGELLSPTQLSSLAWGLEHLEKETRIEPKGGPIPPDTAQIIPQQDKPAIRLQLAVMARALEENLTVLNAELPPAIALWRSAALRDPLPEIRFVWPPEAQPA